MWPVCASQLPSDLFINLQLRFMCRLMSADGLSSGAPCRPCLRWFRSGKHRASWGSASVLRAQAAGESRWHSDTHRCYSTITLLLQRHTLLRESSWEMSSSCLSSLVHISCGDGQKEQKRSERMTNASASTSTNRPSVGELKLDDFWRKSEQYLFVFINAKLAVVGGFSVLLCSCSGVLGGC